jgi:hypothetical protein
MATSAAAAHFAQRSNSLLLRESRNEHVDSAWLSTAGERVKPLDTGVFSNQICTKEVGAPRGVLFGQWR